MNPTHECAPLLLALGRARVELAPRPTDAGRLRHRPAALPPDLSSRMRFHKAALLGLLGGPGRDGWAGYPSHACEARYVLSERLGVADDLGLPTHPGAAAWLIAVGESMGARP